MINQIRHIIIMIISRVMQYLKNCFLFMLQLRLRGIPDHWCIAALMGHEGLFSVVLIQP
jgi:hypothetical protein